LETAVKKLYEAMFLIDSAEATSDWDGINTVIGNILEKADVEIVSSRKWDERKLAYAVNGKARGTYILCYFRACGEAIQKIERQVRLSGRIMRVLILCADHMSQEDIEKDTPATRVEKRLQKIAQAKEEAQQAADAECAISQQAEETEKSAETVKTDANEPEQPEQSQELPVKNKAGEDAELTHEQLQEETEES